MSDSDNSTPADRNAFQRLWLELRRRKVIRVASVYLVTGWLIIQVAESTFSGFGIPDWAFRFVTLMVLLGFPVALILAWALELTPDGIKATRPLNASHPPAQEPHALVRKRNWTTYALGALLPTLIFGGLALFFYAQGNNSAEGIDEVGAARDTGEGMRIGHSIAVMPLVNMSSVEENAYFAGGIHEDVLTNLSRIDNLEVISRTSMLRYAASEMTLLEIGNELGVDYIVEGSVRRIGDHVRVTVQLINASNDLHLWANNYERELNDVFATQSELAREISDSIHLELQPESVGRLEGMPTTSVKAYDLYIRSESLEKTEGETEESVIRRRAMLEEAVAEDPEFVEAWAVLKRIYDLQRSRVINRGWFVNEGENLDAAMDAFRADSQRALNRAISLDADNVEALLSSVVDHDWPKSQEEMMAQKAIFDRLVNTYPEHAKSWYHLGWWHDKSSEWPDAVVEAAHNNAAAAFEEALRLDPFNARIVNAVLDWYRQNGFEEPLPRLAERLNHIVPETAVDRNLARVSWNFRADQIVSAFLDTADESLFEDYETGFQEAIVRGDFRQPYESYWDEATIGIFTNDENRLIELSQSSIEPGENSYGPVVAGLIDLAAMNIYINRGNREQAQRLARRIVDSKEEVLIRRNFLNSPALSVLAAAYAVLENRQEARRLADESLQFAELERNWDYGAMIHSDLERAVDIAFEEITENPNSPVFDWMAAYHLFYRPFLAHPRVRDYYESEGKWIDYLASRVPEYADFQRSPAE